MNFMPIWHCQTDNCHLQIALFLRKIYTEMDLRNHLKTIVVQFNALVVMIQNF